jgi:hypothetical protein
VEQGSSGPQSHNVQPSTAFICIQAKERPVSGQAYQKGRNMAPKSGRQDDNRSPELRSDERAQADELGNDPGQVGPNSAGQSGDSQRLAREADASEESVEELADTDQALEASAVEGVEDAADHPERPVHTHEEYGRPDDLPPRRRDDEAA